MTNKITMDVIRDCSPSRPKLSKASEKHPKNLLEQINQLRRSNELCDVFLIVGNSKISAHKIILSASSPYFRAMFTGELVESKQTEIKIRDIDENAMEMLVDFCYTSKITVDEKSVQTLLPAAYLLQEVQDYCSEFLRSQLDPSNCLGIRAFADTHSCKELLKLADKYLQNNFVDVIESDEFLLLPVNQLVEIISNDELNVKQEEQVYQAVMNWTRHDVEERKQYLGQLLYHVRLPLLDTKYLVTKVGNDPLIKQDQICRDLIDEAKDYHLLSQDLSSFDGPRTKPRKPYITGELLFAVGGWCSGDAISSVEMFDPSTNEWKIVTPMSKRRCGVGVAVLNQKIYAIGGHDGQSYLNSVERYDPLNNQWYLDVAPTSSCRTSVGVAVLDSYLYAVGGQDGVSCLNFVEKYDPQTNRWSRVSSMSTRRLGVAVCVLGNYLYAIGGSDGVSPLNTVERYDPKTNRWSPVASMLTRRKHLGCAVYKNFIYAVGGRDDLAELNSAERYNPQTNQWQPIVSMKFKRSGVGLAVVNNNLYAIGGFDGTTYLKTVEVYDPEANIWKLNGSMIYRRLGGGVGVIKMQREFVLLKPSSVTNASNLKPANQTYSSNSTNQQPQRPSAANNGLQIASSLSNVASLASPIASHQQNSSWPYTLPSLLANVPQANITSNSLNPTMLTANNSPNIASYSTSDSAMGEYNYLNFNANSNMSVITTSPTPVAPSSSLTGNSNSQPNNNNNNNPSQNNSISPKQLVDI